MVLTTSETATSGVLAVLSDTTVTGGNVAAVLAGLAEMGRHFLQGLRARGGSAHGGRTGRRSVIQRPSSPSSITSPQTGTIATRFGATDAENALDGVRTCRISAY